MPMNVKQEVTEVTGHVEQIEDGRRSMSIEQCVGLLDDGTFQCLLCVTPAPRDGATTAPSDGAASTRSSLEISRHWVSSHADLKSYQCPHCPYMSCWQRCVRMHLIRQHDDKVSHAVYIECETMVRSVHTQLLRCVERLRAAGDSHSDRQMASLRSRLWRDGAGSCKAPDAERRYQCPQCPYSTHRRDLYTRHENIHKLEKPFHCYVCGRVFNRADHVKKHFFRMHRGHTYDVKRIRRAKVELPQCETTRHHDGSRLAVTANVTRCDSPPSELSDPSSGSLSPAALSSDSRPAGSQPVPAEVTNTNCQAPPTLDSVNCFPPAVATTTSSCLSTVAMTTNSCLSTVAMTTNQVASQPRPRVAHSAMRALARAETSSKQTVYRCPYCTWLGYDAWCLKRHVNTHTKPFTCPLCPYRAARAERLTFHVQKMHEGKRVCVKCFLICEHAAQLSLHVKQYHQNGQVRQEFTCILCTCSFRRQVELESHMVHTHNKRVLTCDQCTFHTTDDDAFTDHKRYSHTPPAATQPCRGVATGLSGRDQAHSSCSRNNSHQQQQFVGETVAHTASHTLCQLSPGSPLEAAWDEDMEEETDDSQSSESSNQERVSGRAASRQCVRCPHCELLIRNVLHFSLHWPRHHHAICRQCAQLITENFDCGRSADTAAAIDGSPTRAQPQRALAVAGDVTESLLAEMVRLIACCTDKRLLCAPSQQQKHTADSSQAPSMLFNNCRQVSAPYGRRRKQTNPRQLRSL